MDESYRSSGCHKNDEVTDLVSCLEDFGGCLKSSEEIGNYRLVQAEKHPCTLCGEWIRRRESITGM